MFLFDPQHLTWVGFIWGWPVGGYGRLLEQLLCCLPILLWKFLKEHLFPDIDDYYRRNLPKDDEIHASNPRPAATEAPSVSVGATQQSVAALPQADRNKGPSILEHVRSRSDFTPAPPRFEAARSSPASEASRSNRRDIL
jgi:hypothetical protein